MKKVLIICIICLCSVPAFAVNFQLGDDQSLDLYASIHVLGYYLGGTGKNIQPTRSDFKYALESSKVGIKYKNGGFFANIETNFGADGDGKSGFGFRQFYGGYTFSNGLTVTAGRKTSLSGNAEFTDMYYADNALIGYGAISDARRTQVLFNIVGVSLAVIDNTAEGTTPDGFKLNKNIPRFEAAYNFKLGDVSTKLFGSYAMFALKNNTTGKTYDVNAFAVGTSIQASYGLLSLNVGLFYSMNGGMYNGVYYYAPSTSGFIALTPDYSAADDSFKNINSVGAAAELGFNVVQSVTINVGGGYQLNESTGYANYKQSYAAYVNAPIKMNKYMIIKPQVGYYNSVEGAIESGMLLAGVKVIFNL